MTDKPKKAKFSFGDIMQREIEDAIEDQKQELTAQIKLVKTTATTILVEMTKTRDDYNRKADESLASMDSTLVDKVSTMKAEVLTTTQGLVGRVTTLEAENNNLKTKLVTAESANTKAQDSIVALIGRLDKIDTTFAKISDATSGVGG